VSDTPSIDLEAIANLRELNPGDNGEFLKEIVSIYIEDTPKRIAELKQYIASGDVKSFTRAAHTIKGSSANLGAQILKGIGERMEFVARKDGLASMPSMVVDCEAEFAKVAAELRKLAT
jgi:HPt (histidine-containing phosphotransfer) domain-containing protein